MKEMPVAPTDPDILLALSSQIVAAYVAKNAVDHENLPTLIRDVRVALSGVAEAPAPVEEPPIPAVNPKKSVARDHIVCLEDGQKMKMLRRHLQTAHGMTADEYRQRWGLPATYPMTAPAYAAMRSDLAKDIGLGRKAAGADSRTVAIPAAPEPGPAAEGTTKTAPEAAADAPADSPGGRSAGKAAGKGTRKPGPAAKRSAALRRRSTRVKR